MSIRQFFAPNAGQSSSSVQDQVLQERVALDTTSLSEPYHPKKPLQAEAGKRKPSLRWFEEFPWLHWEGNSSALFCFSCCQAHNLGIAPCKDAIIPWVYGGFKRFQQDLEKAREHQKSRNHIAATVALEARRTGATCDLQLSRELERERKEARESLLAIISSLKFLATQEMPIRGDEKDEGNFQTLLQLRSQDIPSLKVRREKSNGENNQITIINKKELACQEEELDISPDPE